MRSTAFRALCSPEVRDVRAHELRRVLAHQLAAAVEEPQAHGAHEEGAGLERREAGGDSRAQLPEARGGAVDALELAGELGEAHRLALDVRLEVAHVFALEREDLEGIARGGVAADRLDHREEVAL